MVQSNNNNASKSVTIVIHQPTRLNNICPSIEFADKLSQTTIPTTIKTDTPPSPNNQIETSVTVLKSDNRRIIKSKARINDSWADFNHRCKYLKVKAIEATRQNKIFTIYGGYRSIRNALLKRGWVEKPPEINNFITMESQKKFKSNFQIQAYPNFIWQPKRKVIEFGTNYPFINRIKRSAALDFTTKIGLIGCIEHAHWGIIDGLSELYTPRYHEIEYRSGRINFLRDYQLTYCINLLKYINDQCYNDENIFDINGNVSMDNIKNAIQTIRDEIKLYRTQSSTTIISPMKNIYTINWNRFYQAADSIMNKTEKFKTTGSTVSKICINECRNVLEDVKKCWPKMYSEGVENLWILKPGYSSQGHGIVIKKNLNEILNFINNQKKKYIVQKYIERPLLIYKTKFDIRQYMMVVITHSKVNIWMYKDCYLRFSTQEYQLNELGQAVHITNNTIQKRYRNGERSDKLPEHNMWTLEEFQKYLNDINQKNIWSQKIYPGMKKNIIAVILASLPETTIEANRFELYGCDFIIMENYEPILIEINATPDMSPTTIVTRQLCPAVLEDVVKVVVDLSKNSRSLTGLFELIHSVNYTTRQTYFKDMTVYGETVKTYTSIRRNLTPKSRKGKFISKTKLDGSKKNISFINLSRPKNSELIKPKIEILKAQQTEIIKNKSLKRKPENLKKNKRIVKIIPKILNSKSNISYDKPETSEICIKNRNILTKTANTGDSSVRQMLSLLTKKMLKKEIDLIGKNMPTENVKINHQLKSYADTIYKKIMDII